MDKVKKWFKEAKTYHKVALAIGVVAVISMIISWAS